MAYIYQIKNLVNGKIYVGKTLESVEKRWKEHQQDSQRERCKERPLYRAMNKYGIDKFEISVLEEVSDILVNEKEKYWIEFLGSYKNGYNATHGGDGKAYADYDLIFLLWNEGKNNKEIRSITGYDTSTIKNALNNRGVSEEERQKRGRQSVSHSVAMIDAKTGETIKIFDSCSEAAISLGDITKNAHISKVCLGKRKTAYGYSWKYIE